MSVDKSTCVMCSVCVIEIQMFTPNSQSLLFYDHMSTKIKASIQCTKIYLDFLLCFLSNCWLNKFTSSGYGCVQDTELSNKQPVIPPFTLSIANSFDNCLNDALGTWLHDTATKLEWATIAGGSAAVNIYMLYIAVLRHPRPKYFSRILKGG